MHKQTNTHNIHQLEWVAFSGENNAADFQIKVFVIRMGKGSMRQGILDKSV